MAPLPQANASLSASPIPPASGLNNPPATLDGNQLDIIANMSFVIAAVIIIPLLWLLARFIAKQMNTERKGEENIHCVIQRVITTRTRLAAEGQTIAAIKAVKMAMAEKAAADEGQH